MSSESVIQKQVLVPIATGSEEIEAVTVIDTLVRGGAAVTVAYASTDKSTLEVVCSRGVKLVADKFIEDCVNDQWDLVVCPGGMPGAVNLRDSEALTSILKKQYASGLPIAAICAAPAVIFTHHGIITDTDKATGYPAEKFVSAISNYSTDKIVVSKNVITSQGPGTSLIFSLKLVEILFGAEKAEALHKEMIVS